MKKPRLPKLTISIVNYNAGQFLLNCLESIEKVKNEADIKVFVVDNHSTDDSVILAKKRFKQIEYILNKDNAGFGRAHNQVLRKVDSGYILILNPDTVIEKNVLSTMLDFMDNNLEVGAATCEIVFTDGNVDLTAHRGFPTPLASLLYFLGNDSKYHLSNKNLKTIHEVDAISGSFFLTKVEVLQKAGLFDEDYFMYAEDIDLSLRIKQAGYKIMYVPTVKILHYKGISSGLKKKTSGISAATLETKRRSLDAFYRTMKIFYDKHYKKKYPFFINWLIYLAINSKWILAKRKLTV